jgi:hypothetical protein
VLQTEAKRKAEFAYFDRIPLFAFSAQIRLKAAIINNLNQRRRIGTEIDLHKDIPDGWNLILTFGKYE